LNQFSRTDDTNLDNSVVLQVRFELTVSKNGPNERNSCSKHWLNFMAYPNWKINLGPFGCVRQKGFLFFSIDNELAALIRALSFGRQQNADSSMIRVSLTVDMLLQKSIFIFDHFPSGCNSMHVFLIGFRNFTEVLN
jgi:hypothetical protein